MVEKYKDPSVPLEERVEDLLDKMTLEQKMSLMLDTAPEIKELGIKRHYHGNEALHGIVRPGRFTVFPQAIGLAATFHPELVHAMASAASTEARARHHADDGEPEARYSGLLTFWSPNVNMARDPRWGRTEETYGEDPWLTSRMGVAFVKGLQGTPFSEDRDFSRMLKVVSTPKHFVANNEEDLITPRFSTVARIPEKVLREYYFSGFRACIVEGKAESIMGAYNAIQTGDMDAPQPCMASRFLLTDVLREQWGFDGYVVTDCGGIRTLVTAHKYVPTIEEAIAVAVKAGIDLNCGSAFGSPASGPDGLVRAVEKGLLSEEDIDRAARRLLKSRFRLGLFDPPERQEWNKNGEEVIGCDEHHDLAYRLALESMVLLKNEEPRIAGPGDAGGNSVEGPILPLDCEKLNHVAVVGPGANVAKFGGYSGQPVRRPVTLFEGIKELAGRKGGLRVTTAPWKPGLGVDQFITVPADYFLAPGPDGNPTSQKGIRGDYYQTDDIDEAIENGDAPVATRIDPSINFNWEELPPDPAIPADKVGEGYGIRWKGFLEVPFSGEYRFKTGGGNPVTNFCTIFIDGKPYTQESPVALEGGEKVPIEVLYQYCPTEENKRAHVTLEWNLGAIQVDDAVARSEELKLARQADVVIAVMGLGSEIEREGKDKRDLALPANQLSFLNALLDVNPRTIVVLNNGSPVTMEGWLERVPAIIEAWYPGEAGGRAIADVIFGEYNPGGRLPVTFYKSTADLLHFNEYDIRKGRTYMYFQGDVLFPFGFGLSYTQFSFDGFRVEKDNSKETVNVEARITNTGSRDGDVVVQVYVRMPEHVQDKPLLQLKAFKRVHLIAGDSITVSLEIPIERLATWNQEKREWHVEKGTWTFMLGENSRKMLARESIEL